jgi:hypothetical protein
MARTDDTESLSMVSVVAIGAIAVLLLLLVVLFLRRGEQEPTTAAHPPEPTATRPAETRVVEKRERRDGRAVSGEQVRSETPTAEREPVTDVEIEARTEPRIPALFDEDEEMPPDVAAGFEEAMDLQPPPESLDELLNPPPMPEHMRRELEDAAKPDIPPDILEGFENTYPIIPEQELERLRSAADPRPPPPEVQRDIDSGALLMTGSPPPPE